MSWKNKLKVIWVKISTREAKYLLFEHMHMRIYLGNKCKLKYISLKKKLSLKFFQGTEQGPGTLGSPYSLDQWRINLQAFSFVITDALACSQKSYTD